MTLCDASMLRGFVGRVSRQWEIVRFRWSKGVVTVSVQFEMSASCEAREHLRTRWQDAA